MKASQDAESIESGTRLRMRRGIRRWVIAASRDAGDKLQRLTPAGIAAFLVASAIAPIAQPLLNLGASGLATVLVGQFGAIGASYLTERLMRTVDRLRDDQADQVTASEADLRDALAADLMERLGDGDAQLAGEIAVVLASIDGIQLALETAVEASADHIQELLVESFASLGGSFEQFAEMQQDAFEVLGHLQREQARQGNEQRHQTDLLRRSLTTTTLLLQRHSQSPGPPAARLGPDLAGKPTPATSNDHVDLHLTYDDRSVPVVPYRGLAAFQPEDAEWFHGREALTAELVARMAERLAGPSMLVVVGASGSGKSSLLRAGFLPALSNGLLPVPGSSTWPWILLTPGTAPLSELAMRIARLAEVSAGSVLDELESNPDRVVLAIRQALLAEEDLARSAATRHGGEPPPPVLGRLADGSAGRRLMIVVDQFEEVFTACTDEAQRTGFIRALVAAAGSHQPGGAEPPASVLLGVRSDFYPRCAQYPELLGVLQDGQFLVGSMSLTEVRRVIEAPAIQAGLRPEPGLVELLLRDTDLAATANGGQDRGELAVGMLPLLSHALLATWQHRQGDTLTLAGYQASGGIRGAIATTAEACYQHLEPTEQALARQLLLRMVAIGQGTEPTRRRVDRQELLEGRTTDQAASIALVLDQLAAARLITLDDTAVELTHEALLEAWPRLHGWVHEDREGLGVHRQLTDAVRIWAELDHDPEALYQGTRLAAATEWASDPRWDADLAPLEREFLDASIARQTSEQRALRRRNRRLLQLTGALAALLVVAVVASGMALQQRNRARKERNQVQRQHQLAVSHALVTQSIAEYPRDPGTGLLLGVAAARMGSTTEARSNLLSLAGRGGLTATLPLTGANNGAHSVAISPDGRILASADSRTAARLWDVQRHAPLATLTGHWGFVNSVAFSPDGRTLVTTSDGRAANGAKLWDVRRRTLLATLPGGEGGGVAFSPDGRILAVPTLKQGVQLWDVRRRTLLTTLPSVGAVALSSDGHTLAVATVRQGVQLWDVGQRRLLASLDPGVKAFEVDQVAFSPNGHTLAVTTVKQGVQLWDVRRRRLLKTIPSRDHDASAVAFSPDGHTVATATSENEVQLWSDDNQVRVLTGSVGRVLAMAFTPDGKTLITGGGEIGFWDLEPVPFLADPYTREKVTFSPDGRTLLVSDDLGASRLWDLRQRAWLPTRLGANAVLSADGRTIADVADRDTIQLWDGQHRTLRASLRVPIRPSEPSIDALALSPDGGTLALLTNDYRVQVWDTSQRARLATLVDPKPRKGALPPPWIAFSPDGRTLAIPAADESGVRLWDVDRRALLAALPGPGYAPAFSPDGRTIATASGNTVRLWSLERRTSAPVATLTGHTGSVLDLAFSPDGHTLASAGTDNTVRLWDRDKHLLVATLAGHEKAVYEVAFSPDRYTLVTASADGTVRQWTASTSHAVTRICALVGHDLTQQQWTRFVPDLPYQHACTQP